MDLGFWEIIALAVLALLIFGPERLPGMARNAGEMIGRFKREANATLAELKRAAEVEELTRTAGEFRDVGRDLKSSLSLRDTAPAKEAQATPAAVGAAPPFDPDAT